MGNKPLSITKEHNIIGYEIVNLKSHILISTLKENDCLIKRTLSPGEEINFINDCITSNSQKNIIIYGRNYLDKSIYQQYNKLNSLGFDNIYVYPGGIFEWLLLQETFGKDMFETNFSEKDILKYKPN